MSFKSSYHLCVLYILTSRLWLAFFKLTFSFKERKFLICRQFIKMFSYHNFYSLNNCCITQIHKGCSLYLLLDITDFSCIFRAIVYVAKYLWRFSFFPKKHCQTTPEPFVEEKYTSLIEFSWHCGKKSIGHICLSLFLDLMHRST